MPNPSETRFLADSWSEVRSHDRVVRYRRSGAGPSVVLLQSGGRKDALWPELLDELRDGHRLIVPEAPPAGVDVAHWLADFLEGLGLSSIAVVASDEFCIPVLELALLGADQVTRVVLVPDGHAAEPGIEGAVATPIRRDPVALLVVRRGIPAAEAVTLVSRFVDEVEVLPPG